MKIRFFPVWKFPHLFDVGETRKPHKLDYFQIAPATICGRYYFECLAESEKEQFKNVFDISFKQINVIWNGSHSHEFTRIIVCTINNKCLFKGILVRRIFHMYSFQLLTFWIQFYP